jgi:hypothetical protein
VFRESDLYTKLAQPDATATITQITDNEVHWSDGRILDLLGNPLRFRDGRRYSPNQIAPAEFAVGKQWTTRFILTNKFGEFRTEVDLKIAARERVTVPAGTFDAFRVEGHGLAVGPVVATQQSKIWYAPEQVRVPIAGETIRRARQSRGFENVIESTRRELVSFKQA